MDDAFALGTVITDAEGAQWVVTHRRDDGQWIMTQIPPGETEMGMGRTWRQDDQPTRRVPAIAKRLTRTYDIS